MTPEPNDPTSAGSPIAPTAGATLSRTEIEALCLKAARGAGMSWGMAEEAGFAAAWLSAHGIDGPGALLAQLQLATGRTWPEICPIVVPGAWRPVEGGRLCPIALGAALSDFAALPEAAMCDGPLRAGPVSRPVLLLPFLAAFAAERGIAVQLKWPLGVVTVAADGRVTGDIAAFTQTAEATADLSLHPTAPDAGLAAFVPVHVPFGTLSALSAFALRTTVPPSETSRAGAGASTNDND
jgi:hypothetical protein